MLRARMAVDLSFRANDSAEGLGRMAASLVCYVQLVEQAVFRGWPQAAKAVERLLKYSSFAAL